jgi:predicted ATP-grasp superfamily ATP-dependent carboligase
MELLEIDVDPGDVTTLVVAMDGWTDAGRGGSLAAEHLRDQYPTQYVGAFDADRLYDFRDRRPTLSIDRGVLGSPDWPELVLHRVDTPGRPILLLTGGEPDFRWHTLLDDLTDLAEQLGLTNYVGLGAVPGPVPHTRPVRTITTSSDPALLDRYGHPHERVVVPASCQVIVETGMRDAGLTTLGLWARVPHYVAGEYPAAAAGLIHRLGDHLGIMIDTEELDEAATDHRERLDEAAAGSPEVQDHITALEGAYDADVADDAGLQGPLPTGDQIAAELERFLRNQAD